MDEQGYPTEEELEKIRRWEMSDYKGLCEYIRSIWHWEHLAYLDERGAFVLHTGGWSGNEEIIGALMQNHMWWYLYWYRSQRGGHYWFGSSNMFA